MYSNATSLRCSSTLFSECLSSLDLLYAPKRSLRFRRLASFRVSTRATLERFLIGQGIGGIFYAQRLVGGVSQLELVDDLEMLIVVECDDCSTLACPACPSSSM